MLPSDDPRRPKEIQPQAHDSDRLGWARRLLTLAIAVLLIAWPIVLYIGLTRHRWDGGAVLTTITLYVIIGIATGTWRIAVGTLLGAVLGLMVVAPRVNGSASDDILGLFSGALLGLFVGLALHLATMYSRRTDNPKNANVARKTRPLRHNDARARG